MAEIKVTGFEDLENLLEDMVLSEEDEKRAVTKAIEIISDEIDKNTPIRKGGLKKSKKVKVSRTLTGLTIGEVKLDKFYGYFQEFGTSRQKKNVGFFARSVRDGEGQAVKVLAKELLK